MLPTCIAVWSSVYLDFGVALAVGLLLGLQRERTYARRGVEGIAGARTFPLVALLGGTCRLLDPDGSPGWVPAAGLVAIGLLAVAAYRRDARAGGHGLTTEVALLLTFALGAASVAGHRDVVAVVGAAALVLAALKERLHGFAGRLSNEDEVAAIKFVSVALLIVPFLPDVDVGPFGALNPRDIGIRVVLVAGISFCGYVAVKTAGAGRGLLMTGLLGGLVSTTATTAAFARRSRETPELSRALAAGTLASCTVMFPRVMVLAAFGSVAFGSVVAPQLVAMTAVAVVAGTAGLLAMRRAGRVDVPLKNPFELAPAVWFAILYSAVVLGAKFAQSWFGDAGLVVAGALAGTTDVDAITLSASRLHATGGVPGVLAHVVVVAAVSNSIVKSGIAYALGSRDFARRVAGGLLATALAGIVTIVVTW